MTDTYTVFSLFVQMANASQQKYALDLARKAREAFEAETPPDDLPQSLAEAYEIWEFETEAHGKNGLWLHSPAGGVHVACLFIQHLLQTFDPEGVVSLEWALMCTNPRVGAYGGGASLITAREIKTLLTWEWTREEIARLGLRVARNQGISQGPSLD